jgi:hypothetical protein
VALAGPGFAATYVAWNIKTIPEVDVEGPQRTGSVEEAPYPMKVRSIRYLSDLGHINPENGNVDVHIELEDGRVFSVLVATPTNIIWCMDNEGIDYYFGTPALFVKLLRHEHI